MRFIAQEQFNSDPSAKSAIAQTEEGASQGGLRIEDSAASSSQAIAHSNPRKVELVKSSILEGDQSGGNEIDELNAHGETRKKLKSELKFPLYIALLFTHDP